MNGFENAPRGREVFQLEDYEDTSYYSILSRLPAELAEKHIAIIESRGLNDDDALLYLTEIFNTRREVTTTTEISDMAIKELLRNSEKDFFDEIETTVYKSPNIGIGGTAKIKRLDLPTSGESVHMAIKYIVTPNLNTLSAEAEHNMLSEVERIRAIEEIEKRAHIELIRVPHTYFHHTSEKIHCYGMELIDGVNLREATEGRVSEEIYEKVAVSLSHVPEEVLYTQIEKFFELMHSYCLHGDIKPGNIMISTDGKFYVIDFGQSVLVHEIPEEGRNGLDDRKEFEVEQAKLSVKLFLRKLQPYMQQALPKAA